MRESEFQVDETIFKVPRRLEEESDGQRKLSLLNGCWWSRVSLEIRVLGLRPKLLEFYLSGLATHPYMPNKETWWRTEKGGLLCGTGNHAAWATVHLLHLQSSSGNQGRGQKVCIVKQSWSQCVDHYLSPCPQRGSRQVVIAVIIGQDKRVTVASWVVCPAVSFCRGSFLCLSW
jgi:hypothetical protein